MTEQFIRPPWLPARLQHPGPRNTQRLIVHKTTAVRISEKLREGCLLSDELIRLTNTLGTHSSSVVLTEGVLAPLHYCFPAEGDGELAAWFSAEHISGRAQLTGGSATVGLREGEAFVHAHLSWHDERGTVRGGHIWPQTVVGSPAPEVTLFGLINTQWESHADPETTMPTFFPSTLTERGDGPGRQSLPELAVTRILPDEDITEAIFRAAGEAGFAHARICAALGSLIGAVLLDSVSGRIRWVDGPATEVISVTGDVDTAAGAANATLHCTLVDRHGTVHEGLLVPGENPVAVTFELTLVAL
jgi:predicted DNA-binding protein with PD1-like motif